MSAIPAKVLALAMSGAAALSSPEALAITVHHHVITPTTTGLIDTIYDTATHVYAVARFDGETSPSVVLRATTTYVPPSAFSDKTSSGWSVDRDSYPSSLTTTMRSEGHVANRKSIIGKPIQPPRLPAPGYNGPVVDTTVAYDREGKPESLLYVQFWYSDGTLTNVTTRTTEPPIATSGACGSVATESCPGLR